MTTLECTKTLLILFSVVGGPEHETPTIGNTFLAVVLFGVKNFKL